MMNEIYGTMKEWWNANPEKYDDIHHGNLSEDDMALWMHYLGKHIGADRRQKVLDIGCGTGFLTLKIASLGYDCRGVDLSSGMMEIARKKAEDQGFGIAFSEGNLVNLQIEGNSVDVITNRSVLWTLFEPEKAFQEWRRVLKPRGKLLCFCSIGNDSFHSHYEPEIEELLKLKGAQVSTLCRYLEQAGFTMIEAVLMDEIKGRHGNNPWYLIKGRKN
jgi:ubiquinone/menaquinone biosynthesis C-methylase UbiE